MFKRLTRYLLMLILKSFTLYFIEHLIIEIINAFSRSRKPKDGLRFLLDLDRHVYGLQTSFALHYNGGVHPKHRLTKYHDFFIKRTDSKDSVLDIGCGAGFVAYDLANKCGAKVTGIDIDENNIRIAKKNKSHSNITYIQGDVLRDLPNEHYDIIILSNVLEHINQRISFLRRVNENCSPNKWLIRVPQFERDWRVPLKKELGVDWRLDDTHFTEYTIESFTEEIAKAGLQIKHIEFRWGEIWSELC